MRKIIWMMSVSVDGYMEGPNREIDWHMVDDELHRHMNGWLAGAGAFLEGRVTYELMEDFWPTADQDPAATPTIVEFAQIWRDMPKIVYSRTLERAGGNATGAVLRATQTRVLLRWQTPGRVFLRFRQSMVRADSLPRSSRGEPPPSPMDPTCLLRRTIAHRRRT